MRAAPRLIALLWLVPIPLYSQAGSPSAQETPKTKLEVFQARSGAVIIRGFERMGEVKGEFGTSVMVDAREFTDAASGRKEYGLTIEVRGSRDRTHTSYVDYDEIGSLSRGLEYIENVKQDVTQLRDFQADYRTRGDLKISVYSDGTTRKVAVESGTIIKETAFLPIMSIQELRLLVTTAKVRIDGIRPAQKRAP